MKLPFEIIRQIIHDTTDSETLANWALVNSAARIEAESCLWSTLTIYRDDLEDGCNERTDDIQDPVDTLLREVIPSRIRRKRKRPIFPRAAFVKRLNLVPMKFYSNSPAYPHPNLGFDSDYVDYTFTTLSQSLINLQRVSLAAHVTRRAWDAVLSLPALKVLHLNRTMRVGFDDHDLDFFSGLYKLDEFLCGNLYHDEASALGKAVRDSFLKKLHITISESNDPRQTDTLKNFFEGVVTVREDSSPSSTYTENNSGNNSGFPSSLIELLIEQEDPGDFQLEFLGTALTMPEKVQEAFYRCKNLKFLYLDAFENLDLAGLLPHLCLPALTDFSLPPVEDIPIIVDFIQRHLDTVETFTILCTHSELQYNRALYQRLNAWFEGRQGWYKKRKEERKQMG